MRLAEQGGVDLDAATGLAHQARMAETPLLLARALCVQARTQIINGRHEAALVTAETGLAAFARLETAVARTWANLHAELLRTCGSALLKLGRMIEALPRLEEAIRLAQDAVDEPEATTANSPAVPALSALIRSLITLGIALFAIRETDSAIGVYYRAMAVADAHPQAYEKHLDDVMLAHWNLTDALHERAKRLRAEGDDVAADHDIAAARAVLDAQAWRVADSESVSADDHAPGSLSAYSRTGFYASSGHHLLISGKPVQARAMFERLLGEIERQAFVDDWAYADAHAGLVSAKLALGLPQEALDHSTAALAALDRHDESDTRATVLRARAHALRALRRYKAAFTTLEAHHALRAGLEAAAAQQYARHMTARLGLERARADAESHRRIATMLETLGKIGQEITANLDTDTVFRMLHQRMRALIALNTFTVWLLDESGTSLTLGFGIEADRPLHGSDVPLDHPFSFAARAARERRETQVDAATPLADVRRLSGGEQPMQTALFVPLVVAERLLGVISVQSELANAYSDNDRLIFRTLSTYGAIALDNAAAYRRLAQTVVTLQATQTELAVRTAEYERLSMTDPLTGVANRRHLDERAAVEIAELRRKGGQLAVAMFDIDHFKRVNDTYGHAKGDEVLQIVARIARDWLRPADFIARVGGEEFALLLPGANVHDAVAIAERIRGSIAETPIEAGSATIHVTSSFGVAGFDPANDTLDRALSRADKALYTSKETGRNRVKFGE